MFNLWVIIYNLVILCICTVFAAKGTISTSTLYLILIIACNSVYLHDILHDILKELREVVKRLPED